jgi:hypothetical protein
LIPEVVSTDIIFAFTKMYTHFIALYSPFYPLSPTPPRSYWCQTPSNRTCSILLFSDVVEEKDRR